MTEFSLYAQIYNGSWVCSMGYYFDKIQELSLFLIYFFPKDYYYTEIKAKLYLWYFLSTLM